MTIANSIVLSDNAYGTIASSLAVGDTTLTFTTGHGARFPTVASGQVLYCCILDSTNILEEVKITAHTAGSDSATMVRAAGSTTAKAWTSGSRVEARISSEVLRRLQLEGQLATTITTADSGATYTGSMSVAALGYITGVVYSMTLATTNSGTAPTIALDGLSAITVKLDGGGALAASQMPINGLYKYDGTNFILLNPVLSTWSTGDAKLTLKTTADTGWVLMDDKTIGDASSSATGRANADTSALFTLLWTNTADADCAVSTGRGASAAADYAAHKTIALPKTLGRALATYGSGSGLTARALGAIVGVESVTLTAAQSGLPSHSHQQSNASNQAIYVNDGGSTNPSIAAGSTINDSGVAVSTQAAGGSSAGSSHTNMGPQVFLNVMIKL